MLRLKLFLLMLVVALGLIEGGCRRRDCATNETQTCLCSSSEDGVQVCSSSGRWQKCECDDEVPGDGDGDQGLGGSTFTNPEDGEVSAFIVGGELTRAFAATGVLLQYGYPICTASLISERSVLTAAHCVSGNASGGLEFAIGISWDETSIRVGVDEAVDIHPAWTGNVQLGSDLAVLHLSASIADVQPVKLHLGPATEFVGKEMVLVGYGSEFDGKSNSGFRRLARVRVADVADEWVQYDFAGEGACKGDSGGPAFVKLDSGEWVQIGVTSWGQVPCLSRGYYQRLDLHVEWLEERGVEFRDAPMNCSEDGTCDGQCETDEDCWELICSAASCKAPGNQCVKDDFCDVRCGEADPDCVSDVCLANDRYPDGVCYQACKNDPDCGGGISCAVDGRCEPNCAVDPDCSCQPVTQALDPYSTTCVALDAQSRVCGSAPIAGVSSSGRSCAYVLNDGSVCAYEPVVGYRTDSLGVCHYYDRFGTTCAQAYVQFYPYYGYFCP